MYIWFNLLDYGYVRWSFENFYDIITGGRLANLNLHIIILVK